MDLVVSLKEHLNLILDDLVCIAVSFLTRPSLGMIIRLKWALDGVTAKHAVECFMEHCLDILGSLALQFLSARDKSLPHAQFAPEFSLFESTHEQGGVD